MRNTKNYPELLRNHYERGFVSSMCFTYVFHMCSRSVTYQAWQHLLMSGMWESFSTRHSSDF